MTTMKILETKGYLKKRRQDRAFLYRPAHPQSQIIGGMIREFVDRALMAQRNLSSSTSSNRAI